MAGFLVELTPWHWLTAAVLLLVIEMLVGSYYLLWVSFAAFLVAILQWIFGIGCLSSSYFVTRGCEEGRASGARG